MSDVRALARVKWAETKNRVRLVRGQSRFKLAVILVFSIVFWFSLYRLFLFGLQFLYGVARDYYFEDLIGGMFYIFFFALLIMLTFSNGIISYTSFFKSRETAFLHAAPIRVESIFLYKFTESLAFSSWAFLFLGTPMLAAYGVQFGSPWHFYPVAVLFCAAFLFIPAALGALVSMFVTSYAPRTKKGLVLGVSAAGLFFLVLLFSRILSIRSGYSVDMRLAYEVFESIGFSRNPLLPSYWAAKGILSYAKGQIGPAFFFLGLIAVNGLFLCTLCTALSARLMRRGWFVSQGLRSGGPRRSWSLVDAVLSPALFFLHRHVRAIVIKDWKSFVRDPVQWSQFLIFFGLLGLYFLNLRTFSYEERDLFWKNLIAQMNLLATSLTLATFSSRFVFPQLSLEGRRFWVIGMVPMERDKILYGKLALCFLTCLVISEVLIGISSAMLRTPVTLAILHAVALFGICLGLAGLAVGLGAVYPSLREENPSKIVGGFGGTLNLVLSLGFVMVVLVIQAVPCFQYFGKWRLTPGEFRRSISIAMAAIGVVSLLACLLPMAFGLRALRRMEV